MKSSAPSLAEKASDRLATEFLAEFIDSKGRDCVSYTKAGIESIIKSLESSAPELEDSMIDDAVALLRWWNRDAMVDASLEIYAVGAKNSTLNLRLFVKTGIFAEGMTKILTVFPKSWVNSSSARAEYVQVYLKR